MRERYAAQVQLLVDVLPAVAAEGAFALKGGTAINLLYRDLPRLSVDIDLTYLPVQDRGTSLAGINVAMDRISERGGIGTIGSSRIAGGGGGATRVLFQRGAATVKVETSPVTRGVVFEPDRRRVSSAVEDAFGFAETAVVSFEDLYGGKIVAALDRQHPRDLFDIKQLYENEGLTDDLFRSFLVYLASSGRPPHELLNPNLRDLEAVFAKEFDGMTVLPVTVDELGAARDILIQDIRGRLSGRAAEYLFGLADGEPDFDLIGLPDAAGLPAIRWKLQNVETLKQQDPAKHRGQAIALERLLLRHFKPRGFS
ncbi:MAG: nucleotidyl transferase AbiEii/AbiGii toxin family protein [Pseudomonadota bacterium]